MSISAALIVKNEETTLPCCLSSIRGHVDQIVVVDTGSEDGTRDVARRYGAELYEYPWGNDFAAARQFSFERTTGRWVFWLDADDELQNADALRAMADGAPPATDGFYWKYVVSVDGAGNSACELWRERCVRNDGRFRWQGRVHEVLVGPVGANLIRDSAVTVVHRPPAERPYRQPRRNLDILEAEYASTKAHPSPRLLLYLGNEYADHGDRERAIEFLRRYIDVAVWPDEKYLAQLRLAAQLRLSRQYDEALDVALAALKTHPDWPQGYFSLGETYYFLQDWPKTLHWIECGRRQPPPDTLCVVNPLAYRYDWIIHYVHALFYTGRIAEACEWSRHGLAIRPDDAWHRQNLRVFESALEVM